MKNVMMILMLVLAGIAAMASHKHDGKKVKKAKAHQTCCRAAHAAAATDGITPACCKAKADGAKCTSQEHSKKCAGGLEGKTCCKGGAAHQHGAETPKTN